MTLRRYVLIRDEHRSFKYAPKFQTFVFGIETLTLVWISTRTLEVFLFTLLPLDVLGKKLILLLEIFSCFCYLSSLYIFYSLGTSGAQSGLKPKPVSAGPTPINIYGNSNNDDDDDDRGSFLENAAGALFGGGDGGGIFGGEGGFFGGGGGSDDDDEGPLDGIGDAIGDFFEGRNVNV